jgi:hypothetical protein
MCTTTVLMDRVRRELKDTSTVYQQYGTDELYDYINESVRAVMRRVVVLQPDFWRKTVETSETKKTLTLGTASYDLPTGLIDLISVQVLDSAGDSTFLTPITDERTADDAAVGYRLVAGKIVLYPTPTVGVTDGLIMHHISTPAEVAAGATVVPLSDIFEDAQKAYVVMKCKTRQEQNPGLVEAFLQEVRNALDAVISRINSEAPPILHVAWRPMI